VVTHSMKVGMAAVSVAIGVAMLALLVLRPGTVEGQEAGELTGERPARGGVALMMWTGGSLELLRDAASGMTSVWVTSDGAFVGYHPGNPDFVNARFRELFPGGQVPAQPMVVIVPAGAYADDSSVVPYASVVPDWIEGLDAHSESLLADPYNYFASWPVIEGYALLGDEAHATVEATRAAFAEQVGDPVPGSPIIQELNISFEFIVASGSVIGVRFDQFEFFGAGGANLATTLWIDTAANERVHATALLDGDAALQQVVEIVREALHRDRPDLSLPGAIEDGTAPTEENYDSIGFTPQGDLLIEFDEYQVGPGSSGSPRVVIPAAIAEPLLSPLGRLARAEVVASSETLTLPTPAPTPTPTPDPGVALPPGTGVDCDQVACVALTFDDGPARPTTRLLDMLKARGAHATFFVVGSNVPYGPELLVRMVAEGHEVGNHTLNHRDLTKLGGAELREQVDESSDAIQGATGQRPQLLRPPYGAVNDAVSAAVGMPLILWSVDPRDWADHDPALVAQRVAADAKRGSIILLHDIHETTVDAVPAILDDLARRGLTPVTVSELLGDDLVAGRVYRQQ